MKNLLLSICLLSLQSFFGKVAKALTPLTAGDIAFTGYISAETNDAFSFVLLKDIDATTTINFTDNSWLNTNVFRTGEQILTWTSGGILLKGVEVKISGVGGSATIVCSLGSATGNMLSLSTSGDQVLAYQGTAATPTFISGIHMNVYQFAPPINDPVDTDAATWDNTNSNNTTASSLPPGLTTGTNAIWVGTFQNSSSEFDNASFNCTGVPGTLSQISNAVNNPANWTKSNGSPATPVVVASGCSFFTVTAFILEKFTVRLNSNSTTNLQWKVSEQLGISKFIIEKSADGISFKTLSTTNANSSINSMYYYTDNEILTQKSYYRIKVIELSGKTFYSSVVAISPNTTTDVSIFPNPVTDKLTINQIGSNYSKTALLLSAVGRVEQQISIINQQHTINIRNLPSGVYYLKMEDGKVFKIIKQQN
jgi:hypothetical protein